MRFDFQRSEALPRLAWCARLRRDCQTVHVRHGPWVETTGDRRFVEGAWDGPFLDGRFDAAAFLAGSGGLIEGPGVLFIPPSHPYEGLYSLRTDAHEVRISNSLVFLLAEAGRELDLEHPDYFFDLLNHHRAGLRATPKPIHVRGGPPALLHEYHALFLASDLVLSRREKPENPPPSCYAEYVESLGQAAGRLCENAGHPARRRRYRPVTTLSRGYDSTAVAAIAARAGCREGVTFRRSPAAGRYLEDDGLEIGRCLGLAVAEYERLDFRALPGTPDVEFYPNPFSVTGTLAVMEDQLQGALLMTGIWGDKVWSQDRALALPRFRMPIDTLYFGSTIAEFRLRTGFVHLPLACWRGLQAPAIRRISLRREMGPYRVGGEYDRPIPRRIAEEAGIPRGLFGQRKAGGPLRPDGTSLSPAGERDFLDFWRALESRTGPGMPVRTPPSPGRRRPSPWPSHAQQWWAGVARRYLPSAVRNRLDPRWGSRYLYVFHWGFERVGARYSPDASREGAPKTLPAGPGAVPE